MTTTNETGSRRQDPETIRKVVRDQYGQIARGTVSSGQPGGCCGPTSCGPGPEISAKLGYSAEELAAVPDGANLGLGCGNPQAIAELKAGETVLDLGAGGGFDCLLAARQVGPSGRVIGVDMTADMISKARDNAASASASNVEFRLGEIEHLPVADRSIDVILSNCVINLSTDKRRVFDEAMRVLAPGGRLAISDVVALRPLPEDLVDQVTEMAGCVHSITVDEMRSLLADAGFESIDVSIDPRSHEFIGEWLPGSGIETYIASARIRAIKPSGTCCGPSCCTAEGTE